MALNQNQHRDILILILKDIYTNDNLSAILGFKGGTAVYLFYNLPRFSVDLDFDLLDESKSDLVVSEIEKILQKYGNIKLVQNKRYSLLFLLDYHDKIKDGQNVKLEINKRPFGSKYEFINYLGILIKVMIKEDIVGNKLVAMYERLGETNRDIFDVWFFLSNRWPINKKIVEQRTNMSYKEFLQTCIKNLEDMSNQNILSGMGELLTPKQKDWVKLHLKNEVVFLLNLELNSQE